MGTIFQAVEESKVNYKQVKKKDEFTGDVLDITASKVIGGVCTCRGTCKTHTGPCSMKAQGPVSNAGGNVDMPASASKMCKACTLAMSKIKK